MRKLTLDVDTLRVESFEPSEAEVSGRGTVDGKQLWYSDTTCDTRESCMGCYTYNNAECVEQNTTFTGYTQCNTNCDCQYHSVWPYQCWP